MEKAWRNGQADLMKFSKEKCKVLLLGRNNYALQAGCQPTGKQICREGPGNPGGAAEQSQQHCPGHKGSQEPLGRPFPCSALGGLCHRARALLGSPPHTDTLEQVQRAKMIKGLKHLPGESWDCSALSREGSGDVRNVTRWKGLKAEMGSEVRYPVKGQ